MAVYVHKMEGQGRAFLRSGARSRRYLPTDPWFVLTADTDDELHAFAESLGLTRVMFRPGKQALPRQKPEAARYPITMGERDRAIELGAKLITGREAGQMLQQRPLGTLFTDGYRVRRSPPAGRHRSS
jgi:Protein of unknown function (DUF4031)